MKIVLLPGADGTGLMFIPLLKEIPKDFDVQVIDYPRGEAQSYRQLISWVKPRLPINEDYMLLAESFSGPIGYAIAENPPEHLKQLLFVATFLTCPNRWLKFSAAVPLGLLLKLPFPGFLVRKYLLGDSVNLDTLRLFRRSLDLVDKGVLAFRLRQIARLAGGRCPLSIPCACLVPTEDRLVSGSSLQYLKSTNPQMEVVQVPGPHFILQAKPKACAQVICRYAENTHE